MVDWQALLEPHHVAENIVRATLVLGMLFLLLRFLPNRKAGGVGEGTAITDAAVQVFTIVGWSIAFDLLGGRIPALRGVLHSDPVEVVRLEGVHAIEEVARAYVEHDGRVSVIRRQDQRVPTKRSTTPKKHRHGAVSG